LLNGVSLVIPAVTKDNDGRLPLHLACLNEAWGATLTKKQSKQPKPEEVNTMVQVVHLLLAAYPVAAVIRDSNGDTPLDLARRNGVDSRIIRALTLYAKRHAPDFNRCAILTVSEGLRFFDQNHPVGGLLAPTCPFIYLEQSVEGKPPTNNYVKIG
jgi:hypothetical protein